VPGAQAQQGAASQTASAAPTVGGFKIRAEARASPEEIGNALASLSFLEMSIDKDALVALNVESRDIQKNPYLFCAVYFRPHEIEALYTVSPGASPKKRRLEVLKYFLNLLSLLSESYSVSIANLYQLLEAAIGDMTEYVTADYDRLFSQYDNAKTELALLQKKAKNLTDANSSLSKENYELKSKNDELTLKLRSLETFSDSVLALKVQEWVSEHSGEINIAEFSKVHNVPEMRVEQILNKLVTDGFLEVRS
jgi:uncharacterized protein YfcZ (UPF0381/DUF406 family)